MIIDIHAHLWRGRYAQNRADIRNACELYGIDRVYLSGLGSLYPDADEIDELNAQVADFMREWPAAGGFCYVNPRLKNASDVLKRGVEEYGMAGMKLWVATFCDDPLVYPLVEQCMGYDIPVLIHTFHKAVGQLEFETLGQNVRRLARRYPQARLIMAHMGANVYLAIRQVRDCPNVVTDISGSIYRQDDLNYTVRQLGARRILFGTDMPDINPAVSLGQVEGARLTDEEKRAILGGNALHVLGHGGAGR